MNPTVFILILMCGFMHAANGRPVDYLQEAVQAPKTALAIITDPGSLQAVQEVVGKSLDMAVSCSPACGAILYTCTTDKGLI